MDRVAMLKSMFIFSGLDDTLIKQVSERLKEVKLSAGTDIFNEGDASDAFYIIVSGEVTIYRKLGHGKEKVLSTLFPGSVFGEMVFFSEVPRTANATVKKDTVLDKISRADFLDLLNSEPKDGLKILSKLLEISMQRLEQTSRELTTIYQTGKVIASGKPLKHIIKEVQDQIISAVPAANNAATFLYNEFNQEFDTLNMAEALGEIPTNHPLIESLKTRPLGLLVSDAQNADAPVMDFYKDAKSFLIVPMLKADNILGLFVLWNTDNPKAFKNSYCTLLSSVASQLAGAIENIKHRQEELDRQRLQTSKQYY